MAGKRNQNAQSDDAEVEALRTELRGARELLAGRVPGAWRGIAASFVRRLPELSLDGLGFFGVGATAYGAGLVYRPAGFIVFGALCIAIAVLAGRGR